MEKQAALLENEKQKTEDLEIAHREAMESWTESLGPRQQVGILRIKIVILEKVKFDVSSADRSLVFLCTA